VRKSCTLGQELLLLHISSNQGFEKRVTSFQQVLNSSINQGFFPRSFPELTDKQNHNKLFILNTTTL